MSLTVKHISDFFEHWAPFSTQAEYDNSGLLLGSHSQTVSGILTCLDVTTDVVDEALKQNCNLIVAHHPLIFRKLSRINPDTPQGSLLYKLISNNIAVLAVHTNLDAAQNGVSFVLADRIGIQNAEFLTEHDTDGTTGFGVYGSLDQSYPVNDFLNRVCKALHTNAIRFSNDLDAKATIRTVAVCGGSGVSLAKAARSAGADAYVTADIKYHEYFDCGMLLVDAGHYETEMPIIQHMRDKLAHAFENTPIRSTTVITNPMQVHVFNQLDQKQINPS